MGGGRDILKSQCPSLFNTVHTCVCKCVHKCVEKCVRKCVHITSVLTLLILEFTSVFTSEFTSVFCVHTVHPSVPCELPPGRILERLLKK